MRPACLAGLAAAGGLGLARLVSPAGQFVSRSQEALLQAGVRMFSRARLTGGVVVGFRLFCRPGGGVA